MFESWFDERFVSAAEQSRGRWPFRLLASGLLSALLSHAAGWTVALAWMAAAVTVEIPMALATRGLNRGRLGRVQAWAIFWSYALAVSVWSGVGAILWSAGSAACDVAAAAFFAGHLLYLGAHHSRSPGAMVPAVPALLAPLIVLAAPHYHGLDQVMVGLVMVLMTVRAGASFHVSSSNFKRLADASHALTLENERAEVSRAEMTVAKEEAEAASRAKSAFLATMSHEIRTPLNGVLGMAQVMVRDPDMPPLQLRRMEVIRESGEALLAILNDVLDL